MTVRVVTSTGDDECPVSDLSSAAGQVSDSWIPGGGACELVFDPPVVGFYAYFGSLAANEEIVFTVFDDDDVELDSFSSLSSPSSVDAIGYGFTSTTPVRRIVLEATDSGATVVGSFVRLYAPWGRPARLPGNGHDSRLLRARRRRWLRDDPVRLRRPLRLQCQRCRRRDRHRRRCALRRRWRRRARRLRPVPGRRRRPRLRWQRRARRLRTDRTRHGAR